MGEWSALDLFVYNSDISYLKSLLLNFTKTYDHYVIFPHFKEGADQAAEIISRYIPSEKLLLLSKLIPDLEGEFPAVFENHENDIYTALNKAIEHLKKYETIKLVFPDHSDYPKAIIKGFYKFCQEHGIDHTLVSNLKQEKIKSGTCYINIVERDLALLLEKILAQKLEVGKDVGIISYNETPLKKFILNGITTISTNFEYMGKAAAQLIKNKVERACGSAIRHYHKSIYLVNASQIKELSFEVHPKSWTLFGGIFMVKYKKHKSDFKLRLVKDYQRGASIHGLSNQWGVSSSQIRKRIDQYNSLGPQGLSRKPYRKYTKEF
ncbi:substrate-binding domain-containing protein, partial [Sphingobacterium sp. T2]|uniref:substrate-binding domain-containing protein n=1 Tax=Sphingobacterium sp. T2 TaxID=1590596 RepID=UPI0029351A3F